MDFARYVRGLPLRLGSNLLHTLCADAAPTRSTLPTTTSQQDIGMDIVRMDIVAILSIANTRN